MSTLTFLDSTDNRTSRSARALRAVARGFLLVASLVLIVGCDQGESADAATVGDAVGGDAVVGPAVGGGIISEPAPADVVHKGRRVSEWAKDLSSDVERTRNDALWELRELGPNAAAAIPALTRALTHDDYDMQVGAARVLAIIGRAAVPALKAAVEDGRLVDDAIESLGALRAAGGSLVAPIFERAVAAQRMGEEKTVWSAANALEEIGLTGVKYVVEQSRSRDAAARMVAAEVLMQYRTAEMKALAMPAVRALAQDDDERVRKLGSKGLEWLKGD